MRVLVTGATGFIGRALVPALQREGHDVVALVRSTARARARLGAQVTLLEDDGRQAALAAAVAGCDAVVNLAGEPVVGPRWTAARKRALVESRVGLTGRLATAIVAAPKPPAVFISSSAVGVYGNSGTDRLTEEAAPGRGFLPDLCLQWEAAARAAASDDTRVALLRIGVVLGRDGGALAQMLPPFSLGLGGPFGHGRQFVPWIHLHDLVSIILTALSDPRYSGVFNAVAPAPVDSRTFARALGQALHRPAVLPVPALALRALLGGAASVLLDSQRVVPARLDALGHPWSFPTLTAALDDILDTSDVEIGPVPVATDRLAPPQADYLRRRPAAYLLRTRTRLEAPLEQTFEFFSRAENLGLITPADMQFRIDGTVPGINTGTIINYRMRVGPLPIRWRTRIARWEPDACFVDSQERGPYRCWYHEHHFRADGTETVMEDRVYYTPPFGLLGRIAHALFIRATLRGIFAHRRDVIRLRFGQTA